MEADVMSAFHNISGFSDCYAGPQKQLQAVERGKLNEWQDLWVDIGCLDDGFVSGSHR